MHSAGIACGGVPVSVFGRNGNLERLAVRLRRKRLHGEVSRRARGDRNIADVPVIDVTVSVAVTVCVPTFLNVALNVLVPPLNVASAGSTAIPSVLEKCTVPL